MTEARADVPIEFFLSRQGELSPVNSNLPALVVRAGADVQRAFLEFFAARIRNPNNR